MIIMLIGVGIIFGGAIAWYFVKQAMIAKYIANMKYPPATITATKVTTSDWTPFYESVGTLVAPQSTSVRPETGGIVKKINFESGDLVKKDQLLVVLNSDQEKSKLTSDKANLRLAQLTYNRDHSLYYHGAVSKQNYDKALATLDQAKAAVNGDIIAINQKQVRAPFTGRIGIRKVSLGEYIATTSGSSTEIATVEQVDPLYVDFQLPQQYIANVRVGQAIEVNVDAYGNQSFKGKIQALSVGVDKENRMVTVRAEVPNKHDKLYSGMFTNVKIFLPQQHAVVTVPQTAITYNFYGDIVYLVKAGKAVETFVTVGQRRGNEIEIIKGVKPGDTIVTSGQLKLFNGSPVNISKQSGAVPRG